MANEISCSASLSASKGGASVAGSCSMSMDMAGSEMIANVQTFTTTGTLINVGGCDEAEQLFIKNMDDTDNLIVGLTNGNPPTDVISTIKPGDGIKVSGVGTAIYAAAATGSVDAFIVCVES